MAKSKIMQKIAVGAAVAGAAGYIAGLLTAPKSGRETRKDLSEAAATGIDDIEAQLKQMHNELGDLMEDAKNHTGNLNGKAQDELKSLVSKAKDSKDKMREVISAVHEGKANNKDLQKAMTDARRAIDHIKDYIQK
jgi:gas vesicle protein